MPKKISKEPGDCVQSENFRVELNNLLIRVSDLMLGWLLLQKCPLQWWRGWGGQPISRFAHVLPCQPQLILCYFVFIYSSHTRTSLPRGGYSCNITLTIVPQSFFPTFRSTTARMVLVNRAKHQSSPSEKLRNPCFCRYTKVSRSESYVLFLLYLLIANTKCLRALPLAYSSFGTITTQSNTFFTTQHAKVFSL